MTSDVLSIYQQIAQAMVDSLPDEWERAYMLIGKQDGMITFGMGKYVTDNELLAPFEVADEVSDDADGDIAFKIIALHTITTAGGNNRWNFLWFTLLPSGAYEIDFIWSPYEAEALDYLEQNQGSNHNKRAAGLAKLYNAQAAHRGPELYIKLGQAVVGLIPQDWTTAWVRLREVGMGAIEYHAAYHNSASREENGLRLSDSWQALLAVEQLQQLRFGSRHRDWHSVTFSFEATGIYHAAFANTVGSDDYPAGNYVLEGSWATASAA